MKYLKQFSLYTLVGVFNTGINFFLMPYLSHYISPASYGILSMVNTLVSILIPLVGLMASGFVFVEYYRNHDKKVFNSIFSSVQVVPIFLGIVLAIATFFLQKQIATFLEIPVDKSYWVPISVAIAFLSIYSDTLLTLNATEQKPFYYTIFSVAKVLIEVSLTLLFVTVFNLDWEGRLLSWLIASVLTFGISIWYFRRQGFLTSDVSWIHMKASVLFGLPLILHTIGKFVINQSDRVFVAKMISIDEAGVYNIGYQIGMVLLLVINAAGNFYTPYLYERLSKFDDRSKKQIVLGSYLLLGLFALSLAVLTLGSPLIFKYMIAKSYNGGQQYVFWVGLSYFFWGVYIVFCGFIFYAKKTAFLGKLAMVNMVLNVLLNYLLVRKFGGLGAAYATCISFLVVSVIVVYRATALYRLPWMAVLKRPTLPR